MTKKPWAAKPATSGSPHADKLPCFGHYLVPRLACWHCQYRDKCIKEMRKKPKEVKA